jgi:hypothetical protein
MDMPIPRKWVAVNAHATDPLTNGVANGLYVGVAGTVTVRFDDAAADTAIPAVAGGYIWGKVLAVRSLGTATDVFALY